MNSILLRVTRTDGLKEDVLFDYIGRYKTIGCLEYPHDNPHYHFWIQSDVKHDTIQKFIRDKCFDSSVDRKDRKFSVKSGQCNLKYLCKGPLAVSKIKSKDFPGVKKDPEIIFNNISLSYQDIMSYHDIWWQEAISFLESKKKSDKVVKENNDKKSWFETLIQYCVDNGITYSSDGWCIAKEIISCYNSKLKCEPNDFQILCYAKSIQRHLLFEHSKQSGNTNILNRYLEHRSKAIVGSSWVVCPI